MTDFSSAAEVRKHLKLNGFADLKFKVRFSRNPFGGRDLFFVSPEVPDGVCVISSGGSKEPTRFGTSDGGKTAGLFAKLQETLKDTNARVSTV